MTKEIITYKELLLRINEQLEAITSSLSIIMVASGLMVGIAITALIILSNK